MYSVSTADYLQADSFSQLGERAILMDQSKSCQCELLAVKKAVRMKKVCVSRELQKRAEQIYATDIEYVYSERFEHAVASDDILHPLQKLCADLNPDSDYELSEFDFQQAQLYTVPLLEKEQEVILFRGMNYLKFRAETLKSQIDLKSPCIGLLDRIEQKLKDARRLRNYIIQANLRLVVSIAKNLTDRANLFEDLVSDGHLPLIRAVEIFDVERGNRFSTYGTWAVRNFLFRTTKKGRKYRKTFLNGAETLALGMSDSRSTQRSHEAYHQTIDDVLQKVLQTLDAREQLILKRRFGLAKSDTPEKFREIAEDLGVSTERVRQLTIRSLQRMREAIEEQKLEIPDIPEII
ncbi:sigma-70 family RNA polymerase sigma factor [Gimesia algae]|uniref:RNA polymerase principal sigma factor HrdB n=1 Tax=Gimesia algae TaxID=2527971 RepID=A0A517VG95_9PLAN|nr:sigma-70 family RNA polymerase sigma factor [Gimesia algae]QDT92048.1 RNA polymerase principal sigma factor HrdB [Gimesia algae]